MQRIFFFLLHGFQCQSILGPIQLRIHTAGLHQFLVGAALGDDTVGNGHNTIGTADGGKAVGNDQSAVRVKVTLYVPAAMLEAFSNSCS